MGQPGLITGPLRGNAVLLGGIYHMMTLAYGGHIYIYIYTHMRQLGVSLTVENIGVKLRRKTTYTHIYLHTYIHTSIYIH